MICTHCKVQDACCTQGRKNNNDCMLHSGRALHSWQCTGRFETTDPKRNRCVAAAPKGASEVAGAPVAYQRRAPGPHRRQRTRPVAAKSHGAHTRNSRSEQVGSVAVQMRQRRAQSQCRCGTDEPVRWQLLDGDPRPSVGASKEKGFHAFRANVGKPSQAVVPLSLAPSSSALQCASYCSLEGEQAPSALQGDRTWSEMPRRVTFHRCRMTMSNTETSTFNTIVTIKTLPPTGSLPAQRWHAMWRFRLPMPRER